MKILILFLFGFFVASGPLPTAQAQLLCSEALKPITLVMKGEISSEARTTLDAQAENATVVDANRLIQKLTAAMLDQSGQRMDFEISDVVFNEVTPVLEKNSTFIKQRAQIQADAAENSYAERLRGTAQKSEKNLLKISQLITQNKTLKKTIYGLIPGLSRRQIEKWSEKVRTLSGESQYLLEQLKTESKKIVAMERSLAIEEANLTKSLDALKDVRDLMQSEAWPEAKNENLKQNHNEILLNLDKQINSLTSIITVTTTLRQQINISLNWNKEAINHAYKALENAKMVSYVSKENLDLTPAPYTPVVKAQTKENVDTQLKTKSDQQNVTQESAEPTFLNRLQYIFSATTKNFKEHVLYVSHHPHIASHSTWLRLMEHARKKLTKEDILNLTWLYVKYRGNFLTNKNIDELLSVTERSWSNNSESGLSFVQIFNIFKDSDISDTRLFEISRHLLKREIHNGFFKEAKYDEPTIAWHQILLVDFLKKYQLPVTTQLSPKEQREFAEFISSLLQPEVISDKQLLTFFERLIAYSKDPKGLHAFYIKDLLEAVKNNSGPSKLREMLKKSLLKPVLINYANAINKSTELSLEDRLFVYKLSEHPEFSKITTHITHSELKHQLTHELTIDELEKISPLPSDSRDIRYNWNVFVKAHISRHIKNISFQTAKKFLELIRTEDTSQDMVEYHYAWILNTKARESSLEDTKKFLGEFVDNNISLNSNSVSNFVAALKYRISVNEALELETLIKGESTNDTMDLRQQFFRQYFIQNYSNLVASDRTRIAQRHRANTRNQQLLQSDLYGELERAASEYQTRTKIEGDR